MRDKHLIKNNMLFFAVFVLLLIAYIGSHFGIFFSVVKFFSISNYNVKIVLVSILVFLSASFFISSVLAHYVNSWITRFYYYISGIWMGFLVNFVLIFTLAFILMLVCSKLGLELNSALIGSFSIFVAVLISIYGTYNAQNFIVKEVSVEIKNLPEYWKGKKIVQLSDVHLGFIYREKFIEKIKKDLNEIKPDMIVITGDLFDGSDGDLDWVSHSLSDISAPEGVYFITGNHETYLGLDKAVAVLSKTKALRLSDTFVEKEGLQIVGIDYPLMGESKNIKEAMEKTGFNSSIPSILLYHAPVQIAEIKSSGISLQLSGHTHLGQLFPFNYITKAIYKGYDYGLKKEGDYSIYTTNGMGTWGPAMRTGNTPEMVKIVLK
jgi:predicted MPP superfamily phosphohydrolase